MSPSNWHLITFKVLDILAPIKTFVCFCGNLSGIRKQDQNENKPGYRNLIKAKPNCQMKGWIEKLIFFLFEKYGAQVNVQ